MRGGRLARNRSISALCAAVLFSTLAGCAAPSSYAGIDLAPGAAAPELQSLAARAQAGDKHAQLELGIRYEEGVGVPVDLERARELYRLAAEDSLKEITVYDPGKPGDFGQFTRFAGGFSAAGLEEAKRRLASLATRN